MISRFCKSLTAAALLLLSAVVCFPASAGAAARGYADNLSLAVAGMEQGKHPSVLVPIRNALQMDRNEPLVWSPSAFSISMRTALPPLLKNSAAPRSSRPGEPLAQWGAALAALAKAKAIPRSFGR